jgi:tRNA pseudouridine55 synthase
MVAKTANSPGLNFIMEQEKPFEAVYLINKPYEWTSFDVVKKVRNALRIKKVGHAGTLDPLATGLLIVCAGKKTKSIDTYQAQEKEYTGTFVLGKTTESFDLEQEVVDVADPSHLTPEEVQNAVHELTGDILQIPPMHSAIKVDGKRVYESARKGKEVIMEPRPVTVSEFEVTRLELPELDFRIVCSKGTYIRSLARDLGEKLQVGAYMSQLTRTRIGEFKLEDAVEVLDLVESIKAERA